MSSAQRTTRVASRPWVPPVTSTATTLVAFAALVWAMSTPGGGLDCDVSCGPVNLTVAALILFTFILAWLVSVVLFLIMLATRRWKLALVCAIGVLIPAAVVTTSHLATH